MIKRKCTSWYSYLASLLTAMLLSSASAQITKSHDASLASSSFYGTDDGMNLTTDAATGLTWLDWTATVNISGADMVNTHLKPGGFLHGWRLATPDELLAVLQNIAPTFDYSAWPGNKFGPAGPGLAWVDHFGQTSSPSGTYVRVYSYDAANGEWWHSYMGDYGGGSQLNGQNGPPSSTIASATNNIGFALVAAAPAGAAIEITFTDDGTDTTVSYSGSLDLTTIGAPTHASVFNPTARVWSVDGILSTGSGSVARWQGLTFARTSGGVGTIGYGAAGDTQPSSRVGDAFSFFHPDRPNGNGNGLLELPVGYTSNSPIQGTLTFLGQTVSDLGVVDTDYTFPDGQVIRISSDYEAGPAVEITFTDDGTNTTASFSGSVDTTLLPAPNTTSVLQPTPYIQPSVGFFGKGGNVTRWTSSITFTRTSGGAGDPFGFGSGVGGAGAPLGQGGNEFLFIADQGRFELPANYVSGTPISGQVTFPGMTVADLGVVDTDYTIDGGQIIRISSGYVAPPAPDTALEIGSDSTPKLGVATLPITLTAGGSEFAISGSISYDPAVFSSPQFAAAAGAPANMTLTQNLDDAALGEVGFLIGLPLGEAFPAGSQVVLDLQLTATAQASKTEHAVTFGDSPSVREVVDELAETITATWTDGSVTVTNSDPVATDDQENTDEDTTLTVIAPGVLSNDTDPDTSDVLAVTPVSATTPGGASVTINADGSISYDPTGSSNLNALPDGGSFNDTVDYTVVDGDGGSDTGTLQVTVAGVNDAPVAVDDADAGSTDEDVVLTIPAAGVLSNDSDPDTGDTITVASVDVTSANGAALTLNGDGSIDYDASAASALLALADGVDMVDTFDYTIEDALGLQASATVSVTVSGVEYEGDVTPRIDGDNVVDVMDSVMIARFVVGLDTPGTGEFSRADIAPRSAGGDGRLTAGDWVQALRYAVALDPKQRLMGPSTGIVIGAQVSGGGNVDPGKAKISMVPSVNGNGDVAMAINMDSTGQVSAVGFSVAFDPEIHQYDKYAFVQTGGGVTAYVNTTQASKGRLGVVIANSNVDQTFKNGKVGLLNLTLKTVSGTPAVGSVIGFEDFPASKSVSDAHANKVVTEYVGATIGAVVPEAPVVPQAWLSGFFALSDLSDPSKEDTVWGAEADPDGDGYPNSEEYAAGTSPIDAKSAFASHIDMSSDSITVSFYPYNENRSYRLLRSDLEESNEWTEVGLENWQPSTGASLGEGRSTTIKTDGEAGFYRVQVSLPNS